MANPALIDELEKQFRDNPRRVFARLANEYRKAGDYMRAIEICHAHVPQQPGYISGHIVLGQALYDAGEYDQAQQTFQTALSLDPENLIALRQLGDIARNRRDYREARSWYTRLLEVDPQNDEVVAQLGEIALAEGEESGEGAKPEAPEAEATAGESTQETESSEPETPVAAMEGLMHNDMSTPAESPAVEAQSEEVDVPSLSESLVEATQVPDASEYAISDLVQEERSFDAAGAAIPEAALHPTPDDDVAWISTETETVEFTISDSDAADDTDFVVTEASRDDEQSVAQASDDFDLTFEVENFDEPPLRPHTGESLSIIAEEDPLAGVQPVRSADPSPFGEPIEPRASDTPAPDPIDAAFEPMPDEDIDAATDLSAMSDLGGETLIDEATSGSFSDDADEEPEPSPLAAEAYETPEPQEDEVFASEIETIVEEAFTESVVSEAPASSETPSGKSEWITPDVTQEMGAVDSSSGAEEPRAEQEPIEAAAVSQAPFSAADDVDGDAPSSAFVTETMAELYLQQGFRNEALDVYRKLAAQSPDDESLRRRIDELERPASSATEREDDDRLSPMKRSAAAFFKSLASVEPPPPPPPAAPDSETNPWDELLSDVGEVSQQDDAAAAALSNGFHPPAPESTASQESRGSGVRAAESKLSLQDIFGPVDQNRNSAGSLDAFFTPEGERVADTQNDEEGREDLEAFNAWLEGLKK
jgi:tetratricopeptide (TPR) repeat protein